jgi:carbonic anhydrase/acetyltransferase-like protein (isoleucine patch superfamily)
MIHSIEGQSPRIAETAFAAWNCEVAGDAEIGDYSSVWFGAVARADLASIRVGSFSNIQDNAVIHVDRGMPCSIGDYCTIGHGAVLHGCLVSNEVIIGMGAIILSGAQIGEGSIVGAGALVTQGKPGPRHAPGLGRRVLRDQGKRPSLRRARQARSAGLLGNRPLRPHLPVIYSCARIAAR